MRLSESLFKKLYSARPVACFTHVYFWLIPYTVARFNTLSPNTGPYWDRQSAPRGVGLRAVWTPTHPGIGPVQTISQDRYGMDAVLSMHHLCLQAPNLWGKPTNHNEWHNTFDTPCFGWTSIQIYSGLSQSLLIIRDRKLQSCHEPSIPVSSHVGWKVQQKLDRNSTRLM